jgi:alpha-ribazole phosphatase
MKTIHFLRHGQTLLNKAWRHQFDDTPLSEQGRAQVAVAAEALKGKEIEAIITSTQQRAQETANIVGGVLGLVPEENVLFAELHRASVLHGVHWLSPRSLYAMGMLYFRVGNTTWHYGDGENLYDFHERVRSGLAYLTIRPEKNILVVTHRGVIATVLLQIQHDGMDTTSEYRASLRNTRVVRNAECVTTTWSPEGKGYPTPTGTWRVGA